MAGNLVKWWKHRILGGYKQFSVQECATDSEELMYNQVRASSSCSAPPDLLLVSDRENNLPLRSDVTQALNETIIPHAVGSTACTVMASSNNNQKAQHHEFQHHQQHEQKQHSVSYNNSSKDTNVKNIHKITGNRQAQTDLHQQSLDNEVKAEAQQSYQHSTRHVHHHQQRSEEHIRLEEFTCDVSVEGGKSSQPLQFSFTFYDLDGHHGKITKDDIVGIVYTIYESIGKSVVVPHSGSKTINVRLTVSPEGKTKSSKTAKKLVPSAVTLEQQNTSSQKSIALASGRRLHRYRPRKLIKSDEEDDDSNSDKEREASVTGTNANTSGHHLISSKNSRVPKNKADQQCCLRPAQGHSGVDAIIHDNIYDQLKKESADTCKECLTGVEETRNTAISPTQNIHTGPAQFQNNSKSAVNDTYMKHAASTRVKLLRKSRKQKQYQDCLEMRQRSLSVGNEACWNNRHLQKPSQQQAPWSADQQQLNNADVLDEVQLRNPLQAENTQNAQKRNSSTECWKTGLNRNDLISIIRESMEKNRLCFQLNGKPQANVSPIRQSSPRLHQQLHLPHHKHHSQHQPRRQQRQRSNTVSKIPMLIANHNNRSSIFTNNNDYDSSLNEQHQNSNNSNSIFHLQPHIPIYHHQMGINPTVLAAQNGMHAVQSGQHGKMNLCGYDSFLHATICGGGLVTPPPHTPPNNNQPSATLNSHHNHSQQIATVQPIISSFTTNSHSTSKQMGLSMGANQIKTSKILRSASYSQAHQTGNVAAAGTFTTSQNSPQYHGYQRLSSGNKQNLSPLNLIHPNSISEKSQTELPERWRKGQVKHYDQLLYAKITEKLQQTNLATTNKENVQRRKHRVLKLKRSNDAVSQANKICVPKVCPSKVSDCDYAILIPFGGDSVECENLIGQTSDDESHELAAKETTDNLIVPNVSLKTRHVAEGTLVDLEDVDAEDIAKHSTSDTMPEGLEDSAPQLEDDLEVNDALEDGLADLEEIAVTESGRNSSLSNITNEATIANTNGANTSATSSLIHRYVHEHIHHHYHHFEDKDE